MDETRRLCGFCLTRMPLSELDGGQCADRAACQGRAGAKFLYPVGERQAELAIRAGSAPPGARREPVTPQRFLAAFPELAGSLPAGAAGGKAAGAAGGKAAGAAGGKAGA